MRPALAERYELDEMDRENLRSIIPVVGLATHSSAPDGTSTATTTRPTAPAARLTTRYNLGETTTRAFCHFGAHGLLLSVKSSEGIFGFGHGKRVLGQVHRG